MRIRKKGQAAFQQLASLGVSLAAIAITLTVAFLVMSEGKDQMASTEGLNFTNSTQCQQSYGCNGTSTLQSAVDDVPGWIPIVVVVVIGGILLGLVSLFANNR